MKRQMRGELRSVAEGLWVAEHKLRFLGTPIVTRMTIVRLRSRDLLVHSPVPLTAEMRAAVDAVGPVRWIIAPSRYHHLYAGEWSAAYRDARLYGPPGLVTKRKDLTFHATLGGVPAPPWTSDLEPRHLDGVGVVDEFVFFHPATRTLLVTDLFFNYSPAKSIAVRLFRRLEDCDGKFCVPRVIKILVRDKKAFAASIDGMLAWDFDRIVVTHGNVVESGGKEAARLALGWLE
jgi:hypothetical protein